MPIQSTDKTSVSPGEWSLRLGALLFFSALAAILLAEQHDETGSAAWAVMLAGCGAIMGLLFLAAPVLSRQPTLMTALLYSLALTLGVALVLVAMPPAAPPPQQFLRLSCALFLITLFYSCLLLLLYRLVREQSSAKLLLLLIYTLMASTPLWLGPAVERSIPGFPGVNTVIAVTPISYLAMATDYDYLHSSWFYRYSPLGSLRYDYPDEALLAIAYLAGSLSLHICRSILNYTSRSLPEPINSPVKEQQIT